MVGTRVQIPAWTDEWMMGDRYGEVKRVVVASHLDTNEWRVKVKLDKSGKTINFWVNDLTIIGG
mgnify:CR=1 FL=1|tara:strand:- start:565 stop:756 length:192 start_codon:yes stop_codon:yes gene_type:complete